MTYDTNIPERYMRHREPDHAMAPLKVVVLLCVMVLAVLVIGVALMLFGDLDQDPAEDGARGGKGGFALEQLEKSRTQASTPRSEWRAGVIPRLFQTDPEWAAAPYGDGSISTHGCGPTCLSMVYVALTGATDLDPRDMAEFSELNGFLDGGVTSWLLMSQGAALLGLDSVEVPASAESVEGHLLAGEPVICSVHEGDFTTEGHFIVLAGLNADGTVEIRDPNSEDRTNMSWDLGRVISQCDNIWAFSV